MGSPSSTSYTGTMLSLKLGLILCVFFIIGMEAAPEPNPEDLHIHLNLHDPTSAAKKGDGVAQAAGRHPSWIGGACLNKSGIKYREDKRSGVTFLGFDHQSKHQCLNACLKKEDAPTACEFHPRHGCYVYTKAVSLFRAEHDPSELQCM